MNTMVTTSFSFFGIILLIGLIVPLARVMRKRPWTAALIVPLAFLLLGAGALFTFKVTSAPSFVGETSYVEDHIAPSRHYSTPATPSTPEPPQAAEAASTAELPAAESHSPAFDHELLADIYPSAQAGAAALTRQILQSLDKIVPDNVKLGALVVEGGSREIRDAVAAAARARLPGVEIGGRDIIASTGEGQTHATLELDTPELSTGRTHIAIQLTGPDGGTKLVESVNAVEKPWMNGLPTPPPDCAERFVIHSEFSDNPGKARTQAMNMAAERLQSAVELRLRPFRPNDLRRSERQWLSSAIRNDMNRRGLVKDQFDQRIQRSYGQVWRNSLFVQVLEPEFQEMVREYRHGLQAERTSVRNTLLMAAGLALGIILLYLFLNAATKGYYMWPLRLLGIVAVAAGVCIVLRLA